MKHFVWEWSTADYDKINSFSFKLVKSKSWHLVESQLALFEDHEINIVKAVKFLVMHVIFALGICVQIQK